MKFPILLHTLLLYSLTVFSQGKRFVSPVFDNVKISRNFNYGETTLSGIKSTRFDLYEPDGDSAAARPLIILMHGGGFRFGSKNVSRMKIWGRQFASKGYVVAAVNYRKAKGKPLSRFPDLAEGCIIAAEDLGTATRFFKSHFAEFRIDTSKIIFAGHSAGGMIALQAVYASPEEIRLLIRKGDKDHSSSRLAAVKHNVDGASAVVNFWGAVYDTTWLQNANVPIVSVHGGKDRVVPPDFKDAPVFGSKAIHRNADRLGIPNQLRIYEGKGHELQKHFNPIYAGPVARKRWREAGEFAAAFLYDNLIR